MFRSRMILLSIAVSPMSISAADGLVDLGFGVELGHTKIPFESADQGKDQVASILVGKDQRVTLVGTSRKAGRSAFTIVRLGADGRPDLSYGTQGAVISSPPGEARDFTATAAALQSDGKIVIGGYIQLEPQNGDRDIVVCRFTSNGDLDPSFGSVNVLPYSGCEQHGFSIGGNRWDAPLDLLVQPDGRIVFVGYTTRTGGFLSGLFVRLHPDGKLDPTFYGWDKSADGWSAFPDLDSPIKEGLKFTSIVRRESGEFVIAHTAAPVSGDIDVAEYSSSTLHRVALDGTHLDTYPSSIDFGVGGNPWLRTQIRDTILLSDGVVLAAGWREVSPGNGIAGLAMYKIDGWIPETGFSGDGVSSYVFCDFCVDTRFTSIVKQHDGNILAAGQMKTDRYRSFVARIRLDGTLDKTFGENGAAHLNMINSANGDELLGQLALDANRPIIAGNIFVGPDDAAFSVMRLTTDTIFASGTD